MKNVIFFFFATREIFFLINSMMGTSRPGEWWGREEISKNGDHPSASRGRLREIREKLPMRRWEKRYTVKEQITSKKEKVESN